MLASGLDEGRLYIPDGGHFLPLPAAAGDKSGITRISHHLTVEARNRPAITALRLLAVLNVGFKYARIPQKMSRRPARALY